MSEHLQRDMSKTRRVEYKKKILIVDDKKEVADSIKRFLEYTELYSVQTIQDGEAAINLLNQKNFNLLITDYDMPEMNGYELFKKCRAIEPELPVVFMTGDMANDRMIENAKKEGFVGHIHKPFDIKEMIMLVGKLSR